MSNYIGTPFRIHYQTSNTKRIIDILAHNEKDAERIANVYRNPNEIIVNISQSNL